MPIAERLLQMLRCPETGQGLRPLTEEERQALNERIDRQELRYVDGSPVESPLLEGLIREDGARVYRIDDEIPMMLAERGIPVD